MFHWTSPLEMSRRGQRYATPLLLEQLEDRLVPARITQAFGISVGPALQSSTPAVANSAIGLNVVVWQEPGSLQAGLFDMTGQILGQKFEVASAPGR